ncbi:helix-turn-helix domain-containing protein [Oxyplasma meridianum]|uniref:Helix-turn-helix domain-containing protein n=1 Tax=Oxyplasma meridianum TaxID=3073602 RepID=A0AAX4NI88_9ARCH
MPSRSGESIDALIEVTRSDCKVTNEIYSKNYSAEILRLKVGEDSTIHKVICLNNRDEVYHDLKLIAKSASKIGKNTVWVESLSCSSCHFFASQDIIVSGTKSINRNHLIYRIILPSKFHLKELMEKLEKLNLNPVLIESHENLHSDLTPREKEIIELAYKRGYYDTERKMSMKDLANELHVSASSLSDVLRRGTKKIVKSFVDNNF